MPNSDYLDSKHAVVKACTLSSEKLKTASEALIAGLSEHMNEADVCAVLATALLTACVDILHTDTPMPEHNIKMMIRLINDLRSKIFTHFECAREMNKTSTDKPAVH